MKQTMGSISKFHLSHVHTAWVTINCGQ